MPGKIGAESVRPETGREPAQCALLAGQLAPGRALQFLDVDPEQVPKSLGKRAVRLPAALPICRTTPGRFKTEKPVRPKSQISGGT